MLSLLRGEPIALIYNKDDPKTQKINKETAITLKIIMDADGMPAENYVDDNIRLENNVFTIINPRLKLQPLPRKRKEQNMRTTCLGPTGSGKSSYTGKFAEQYKKMFKDNPIVIFSRHDDDKNLDYLKPIRIPLTDDLLVNPIDIKEELHDSLVIFDDIETPNKALTKYLIALRDDLLSNGRHYNTYVSTCIHQSNFKETRLLLGSETSQITIFPKAGGAYNTDRVLKTYGGMDKNAIAKIKTLPSRWVTVNLDFPNYVIYEKGAYMT